MLKLAGVGLWAILVTAATTYGSVYLSQRQGEQKPDEDKGVEEISSDMTSIPVMRAGDVVGYVIVQLSFAADRVLLEQKKIDPAPFLKDAAFRVIFTSPDLDFKKLKPEDLERLSDSIAKEANRRIGSEFVRHVLFQQLSYVRKDEIRTNWISGGNAGK